MRRRITRTRYIKHIIAGEPEWIPEHYQLPAPPIDWDHVILNAVVGMALLFMAGSMAWTTASIGDLLAQTVPAPIAYAVSGGYDAAWIVCLALEWLSRYDRNRAKAPRIAGHITLAIAVAAVAIHGATLGAAWAAGVGAVLSILAKGLWMLVLRHIAAPLDDRTQAWLQARRSRIAAQMALGAQMRQLHRMNEQHNALTASSDPNTGTDRTPDTADTDRTTGNSADTGDPDRADTDRTPDMDTADTTAARPVMAPATVRSAILGTAAVWPHESPEAITVRLAGMGIDTDTDTVRTVLGHQATDNASPDTDADTVVRPIRTPRRDAPDTTVADTVRAALEAGVKRPDLLTYVRSIHGQDTKPDAVRKAWDRATGRTAQ